MPDGPWSVNGMTGLSSNDLIHEVLDEALDDPLIPALDRLHLGFGMLDHFDDYAAAMYLRWQFHGSNPAHADKIDLVWSFCREMLERERQSSAVEYWLWVDWFEDRDTSDQAFGEVIRGCELDRKAVNSAAVIRRIDRVIRNCGPVAWDTKAPVYRAAVNDPRLHDALAEGLARSVSDIYGQIDTRAAASLSKQLRRRS